MMKWKFCEFCYINDHCENQDRGHKCECYGKKLEDKCERLEKQLKIAVEALKCYGQENWTYADEYNYFRLDEYTGGWCHAEKALEQIKGLDK